MFFYPSYIISLSVYPPILYLYTYSQDLLRKPLNLSIYIFIYLSIYSICHYPSIHISMYPCMFRTSTTTRTTCSTPTPAPSGSRQRRQTTESGGRPFFQLFIYPYMYVYLSIYIVIYLTYLFYLHLSTFLFFYFIYLSINVCKYVCT